MAKKNEKPDVKPDEKPDDTDQEPDKPDEEPETFTREYVDGLRDDLVRYRVRSAKFDEYSKRLHRALVEQTGRLADPADLEFNLEHLDDPETLTAAIDDLLDAKPHLKSRTVQGDVNQGVRGDASGDVDFMGAVRAML